MPGPWPGRRRSRVQAAVAVQHCPEIYYVPYNKMSEALLGRFVNYFVTWGCDALWDKVLIGEPNASLFRLWRDTGLYDGDGTPRPSLSSWRSVLSRPLRQ